MAGNRRDRQRASREARLAAVAEARRRAVRRRWTIGTSVVAGVVLLTVVVVAFSGDSDPADVTAGGPTTTAAAPGVPGTEPAKPCVAVSDPVPAGTPSIPVRPGPPPTSLVTEDLKPGQGPEVKAGDTVTAHYIGATCSTGRIFDSSYSRGQPFTRSLAGVIEGWQRGIPGMKVGGQRLLGIPPDLAYGPQGNPPTIGPDETLWFVVEILDTKPS